MIDWIKSLPLEECPLCHQKMRVAIDLDSKKHYLHSYPEIGTRADCKNRRKEQTYEVIDAESKKK